MPANTQSPTAPIIFYEAAGQAVEVRLDANAQTVWLREPLHNLVIAKSAATRQSITC